ncbi:EI24 domain-containing protein [Ghiorsea bivora]|uniref:EI24 domain-containing protein n=1 Tax=Ghiorsea bivora TaxID=1485545 RepID=UPI00068E2C64|nr:EI24 domain-containing protein [Ghiorsea bivora]
MIEGVSTFFSGLIMLFGKAELRAVLWRMLGLLAGLMLVLMLAVFFFADYLASIWIPEGDAWYWVIVGYIASFLAGLLSVVVGAVAFVALASAAAAPWLDTLAYRTEKIMGFATVENDASWANQALAAAINSIRPLFGLLLWGLLALVFFWFPPLMTVIWTYGSIQFLNYELFDTQASRKDLKFSARKADMKKNRWFWLGFGGTSLLLMVVPILNIFVLPAAVVALAQKGHPESISTTQEG